MSQLILTLRQATTTGVKRILRTSNEINSLEIAPDYPIARWRNDPEVDREERRFFRTLTNKAPFWNDVAESYKDKFDLSQVWYEEQEAQGLGFALIIDGLAISLNSGEKWNYSQLQLKLIRMNEHDDLIDEQVENIHACCKDHIKEHVAWIKTRIRSNINNGKELWNRKQELFPNLEFCDSVKKQLENILSGQPELRLIVKALFILQNGSQNWQASIFSLEQYAIEESGESQPTLEKYSKERTFICPDGQKRLFERHVKLRLCNWRIHFYPDNPGTVTIGYIGRHLPTVKYK
ncbi:MAG: hypothetical protein AAF298_03525 [Cyanobacteria bacterium P01_A01_bin.40]